MKRHHGSEGSRHRPRHRTRLSRIVLALAVTGVASIGGLLAPSHVTAQNDLPASSALVPETALAYISLDLDRESDQWQRAEALLARAGFPTPFEDLERGLLADAGMATPTAEPSLDPFLGGEAAIVLTELPAAALAGLQPFPPGPSDDPLTAAPESANGGFAAILVPSDPDAAWDVVQDRLQQQADREGSALVETPHRDVTIRSLEPGGGGDAGPSSSTAVARVDDVLLIAPSPAGLEPIIDTSTGETPPLRDVAGVSDVRAELNPDLLGFGYLNYRAFADLLGPDFFAQAQALSPGTPLPIEQAFDLDAGVGIWADDPGLRFDVVAIPGSGQPLPSLGNRTLDVTLDERVPADTLYFQAGADLGPSNALVGVAGMIARAVTQGFAAGTPVAAAVGATPELSLAAIEEQFDAAEQVLGFDLRADLLERLVGEFAIAASLEVLPIPAVSAVFVSGIDDAPTVADSLQRVARLLEQEQPDADVSTRQVEGETVYVLSDTTDQTVPTIEFGVVADQVLIGAGAGLDDFVAGPTASLADDERYRRVLATLPDEYTQIQYVNLGRIVSLLELTRAVVDPGIIDADPGCAEYDTQEEAQAAFEGATGGLELDNLNRDFDGRACEDYFAPATPAAAPGLGRYAAIEAFASVTYVADDRVGASAILYIGEPSS